MQKSILNILFLFLLYNYTYSQSYTFEKFSVNEGLPHSMVTNIVQDNDGFLWMFTGSGLYKYDGYTFFYFNSKYTNGKADGKLIDIDNNGFIWGFYNDNIFKINPRNESIEIVMIFNTPRVSALLEDSRGVIWYGTNDGKIGTLNTKKEYSVSSSAILTIYEDKNHILWIGTIKTGLFSFDINKKQFNHYDIEPNPDNDNYNTINCIYEDSYGNLWLGAKNFFKFDRKNHTVRKEILSTKESLLSFSSIRQIIEDKKGWLWISTNQSGLFRFQPNSRTLLHVDYNQSNSSGITSNFFLYLFLDRSEVLWIASLKGGLCKLDMNKKNFHYITSTYDTKHSLSHPCVNSVYVDNNGLLWVLTGDAYLNCIDRNSNTFYSYRSDQDNPIGFRSYSPNGYITQDKKGNLWILSWLISIIKISSDQLNPVTENIRFINYFKNQRDTNSFQSWSFRWMLVDHNNNIWIAGTDGLDRFDEKNHKNFHYVHNPENINSLSSNFIWTIYEESNHILYIGTANTGFDIFDPKKNIFINHSCNPADSNTVSSNSIRVFCEAKNGMMWIGTSDGLNCYNKNSGQINRFHINSYNDVIYGILEDNHGNLWLSTENGLICFTPPGKSNSQPHLKRYYFRDGIQSNEFNIGSFCKDNKTGEMFFGGPNGLTYFHPDSMKDNPIEAKMVLTSLRVMFRNINPGDTVHNRVVLKNRITNTDTIVLHYYENIFSIEFSAIHNANPANHRYAYKLEGFQNNWNYVDAKNRTATYSNLNPGTYIFKVIGTNNDDLWCTKEKQLTIIIIPPFWLTWWFRILVVLILLAFIILLYHIRLSGIKKQKRNLEVNVQLRTAEVVAQADVLREVNGQMHEQQVEIQAQAEELSEANHELQKLDATKDKFFSIISHDLKNPMHAIHGLAKMLNENSIKMGKEQLQEISTMLEQSSSGVTALLENLLTWTRSQSNRVEFIPEYFDLYKIVTSTFKVLKVNADNKGLKLISDVQKGTMVYADQNMITTIVRNLVNNAIKFTQQGSITVKDEKDEDVNGMIKISVIDTGVGMDEETRNKLFRIDVHHTMQGTSGESGTGLGLLICKEFIEKNNGSINIKSEVGKGSRFIIILPRKDKSIKAEQKSESIIEMTQDEMIDTEQETISQEIVGEPDEDTEIEEQDKPIILLVEDTPVMRINIKNVLVSRYKVIEAANGQEAINYATDIIPDLIVSDWMMPVMDGIEFCKQIKSNELTSHVPIIMLTAKTTSKDKIVGFETGADDYITKPFDDKVLIARVKNLIETRKKLREKFSSSWQADKKEAKVELSPIDIRFIKKTEDIIEENIIDIDFDVKQLSKEIGISRPHLYRKLIALTGLSPTIFIRNYRLRKAAGLLSQKDYKISAVMEMVGFNHATYFSKCFKETYGILPTQYHKNFEKT